jgi:hypothetical protein
MSNRKHVVTDDIRNIIDDDRYAWIVCWGPPRYGKSSLCLLLSYYIYRDWDKVLDSVVFNLNQLLYKLEQGIPEKWPTKNLLHMRIPLLIWDDYACHAGKAKTQHERSWDIFKGAFDSLGVKLGVLIANMVTPSSPTQQLTEKYTHELYVYARGRCKYDKVRSQQAFYDFQSRQNKVWQCDFEFEQVPRDVFKQYDEMRCSLADEVLVSIKDVMATTETETVVKRMQPMDIQLLRLIQERGPIYAKALQDELGDEGKKSLVRMKARGLVVPRRESEHYYRYDMTDLAISVLNEINNPKNKQIPTFPNPNT